MAQRKTKDELEDDLRLLPESFSVHVLIDKRRFKDEDRDRLVGAIKDVVYAMKVQNIGHYPLEFDAHNAHVSIRKHLSTRGERISVSWAR